MKTILINEDGYLQSPYIEDATIEIEVSDELYEKTLSHFPMGYNWRYVDNKFVLVQILDEKVLKFRRDIECFRIIDNRSPMWYNHLTAEQKQELDEWYQAWLDVTKTKVVPVKPKWL